MPSQSQLPQIDSFATGVDEDRVASAIVALEQGRHSQQAVSEATLVAGVDATKGEDVVVTLTAARVMGLPTNGVPGQRLHLLVTQGGAGGFALTFVSGITVANWTMNLTAGSVTEAWLTCLSPTSWAVALNPPSHALQGANFNNAVNDYAADPTGVADSATAINNALTAVPALGGAVFAPPGNYKHQTALSPKSNCAILGAGEGVSILKPTGANVHGINAASGVHDLVISDLTIDGSAQTTSGYGIYLQIPSYRIRIQGVEVLKSWSDGIFITPGATTNNWDVAVLNCHVHNTGDNAAVGTGANGIRVQGGDRILISHNRVHDCTRQFSHGVVIEADSLAGARQGVIVGNVIENMGNGSSGGGGGVAVTSSATNVALRTKQVLIHANTCLTSADSVIWVNADQTSFTNNSIDGSNSYGIEIQDCIDGVCANNMLRNTVNEGIVLHNGPGGGSYDLLGIYNWVVGGNTVDTVTGSRPGIQAKEDGASMATATRGLSITGNVVRNCKQDGIILANTHGDSVISGNTCLDNVVGGGANQAGITLYGTTAGGQTNGGTIVTGNRSGDTRAGGARTQTCGILVANQTANVTVMLNDVSNNVSFFVRNTSTGTGIEIRDNKPDSPHGTVTTPGFPATTVGVQNTTGYDVIAYVTNGAAAMTAVITGVYGNVTITIPISGFVAVRIPAGQTFTPTYASGAPAWVWYGE